MGNKLQHGFNLAPCICFEWGESLGSLGCCLLKDMWYDAYHKNYIWPYSGLRKQNVKVNYIIALPKCVVASTFEIAFNQPFLCFFCIGEFPNGPNFDFDV
jgi:hypothetical protein